MSRTANPIPPGHLPASDATASGLPFVWSTLIAVALFVAAVLSPAVARAQIKAPSMLEDDLAPEEPLQKEPRPEPVPKPEPGLRPSAQPRQGTPAVKPGAATQPQGKTEPQPRKGTADSADAAQPSPDQAMLPSPESIRRRIEPVSTSERQILELWQARRMALREQDNPTALKAKEKILSAMRELGIESLSTYSAAEVREAEKALAARIAADALEHATFAVALAPNLADAHVALARALWASESGETRVILSELRAAVDAAMTEPHTARALLADICGAGLAALFTAAAASIVLFLARRLRLFLHDFHHLPLVRAGAPVQGGLLALVLLSLPLVFRLGPFAVLATFALAVWLYLSLTERIIVTVALLALVALPWLAGTAARATVWTGTLAEQVMELEQGEGGEALAAKLTARAATEDLPGVALMALGRHAKQRGELDAALRLYERAAAGGARTSELDVNRGNALFLKGDLENAKAAYLSATDRNGVDLSTLAAAHYNLYKVYVRLAALNQAEEARKKALQEDGELIERYGSDDDFRANRFLIDVSVPQEQLEALAASDGSPQVIAEAVRARLAGAVPPAAWPAAPLVMVGLLWLLALMSGRIAPSSACERCGHPACRRCDGLTRTLCGQCVNVFTKKGVVDARDRLRKEAQVRRYAQWKRLASRILAVLGGGAGHLYAGDAIRGFLLLFGILVAVVLVLSWHGIMPPPFPSPYAPVGKLAVALVVGVALYALAVWNAFRRSRD